MASGDGVPVVSTQKSKKNRKLHRFRFTARFILYLVKSVREHDVHRSENGAKDMAFFKVFSDFLQQIPINVWTRQQKATVKALRDKFRSLMSSRQSTNPANEKSSGIVENISEADHLLDDFLLEQIEIEEARHQSNDNLSKREKRLQAAGEAIQDAALKRKQPSID